MAEIWKDIPGYEGFYQISNLGNVKSLERFDRRGIRVFEKILKQGSNRGGYMQVALCCDGDQKSKMVHKLVAISFLGHTENGYKEVIDHIDNDKKNNNVENLQITNQRDNIVKHHIKNKKSSSGYTGVSWCKAKNKWVSHIHIKGQNKNLGAFDNEIEAHKAYIKALETI